MAKKKKLVKARGAALPPYSLQMGYQGGTQNTPEVSQARAGQIGASWTRIIATTKDDPAAIAAKMRAAKTAGQRVILTVGGTGTSEKKPGVKATKAFISKLPRADKYTWTNEPNESGKSAANYGRGFMELRKTLGKDLLFGDLSPYKALEYTQKANKAAHLPKNLDLAVHPYQQSDPLAKAAAGDPWGGSGSFGNLGQTQATLKKAGIKTNLYLDEFGYQPAHQNQWGRALKRAKQLHAKMLGVYDVKGPTWDTGLTPAALAALVARRR